MVLSILKLECHESFHNLTHRYMVADSAAMAIQYGHKEQLCTALASNGHAEDEDEERLLEPDV